MRLAQGAEAILSKKGNSVIKDRVRKSYRISELDYKLRNFRTKREAKLMSKLDFVPKILNVDETKLEMEFVKGKLIKDILDNLTVSKRKKLLIEIGEKIGIMHDLGIIHGDLTTSNMILNKKVYFIDFGLGFVSDKAEHKAVDLHLIKQALQAKHYQHFEESFSFILDGYRKSASAVEVLNRLAKVEKRGRYKRKGL